MSEAAPYAVRITRQAKKDIDTLTPKLRQKLHAILVNVLARDPYEGKKLIGDLAGTSNAHGLITVTERNVKG